jgi:hypothetical protein
MNSPSTFRVWAIALLPLLVASCDPAPEKEGEAEAREPSPNATITPSPLVVGGALVAKTAKSQVLGKPGGKRTTAEVTEPPVPFTIQQAPSADVANPKQLTQISLVGRLVWPAYPNANRPHPTPNRALDPAPTTQRRFDVNLRGHGRMQVIFHGTMFPFASETSIASRIENYGHLLIWPDEGTHRVLPVGSVRALLGEGRPDVTPVVHLDPEPRAGGELFDHETRVWTFESSRGKLTLQQLEAPEAELGGVLLCRFLLEWLSVAPTSTACDVNLVPVRAEFESRGGSKLVWETSELEMRTDPPVANLPLPPRASQFREYGLPEGGDVMSESERGSLRKSGRLGTLTVHNPTPQLGWALLDGVPVARITPNGTAAVQGVSQGTYHARLVDFFGVEGANQPGLVVDEAATFGAPKPPPVSNPEQ